MKIRIPMACLLLWVFVTAARAQAPKCDICGEPITIGGYTIEDRVTGEKKNVCNTCHDLKTVCFVCNLPVKEGYQSLPDGRYLCARDSQEAVSSESEAREICIKVRDDLDHLFSRFLTIPDTNVVLTIADKYQLENLFRAPGNEDTCVTYYGATSSNPLPDHKFIHHVSVLSYLKKSRLMAVCAHEYTHAWMGENVSHQRKMLLDRDSVEGFCELVAYKYMESLGQTSEMRNIRHNHYTKGQIDVLIETDRRYGFDAVMEWIKSGEDDRLDMANLDRVRAVRETRPAASDSAISALLVVPPTVPSPVPDTLQLKGVSGSGRHRFALINDATLETMESGKVRVGQTNIMVRCLEIRDNSVVIEVGGSGRKMELFLRAK